MIRRHWLLLQVRVLLAVASAAPAIGLAAAWLRKPFRVLVTGRDSPAPFDVDHARRESIRNYRRVRSSMLDVLSRVLIEGSNDPDVSDEELIADILETLRQIDVSEAAVTPPGFEVPDE